HHRLGKWFNCAWRNQEAVNAVGYRLPTPRRISSDDGPSHAHRFQHHSWRSLTIRRQHKDRALGDPRPYVTYPAGKLQVGFAFPPLQLFNLPGMWKARIMGPHHDELRFGTALCDDF